MLVVESEHDDIIPHPVIENYLAALKGAGSLTYRVIEGRSRPFQEKWQQAYTSLLLNWATEMVLGAREGGLPRKCVRISSRHARNRNGRLILRMPHVYFRGRGSTRVCYVG